MGYVSVSIRSDMRDVLIESKSFLKFAKVALWWIFHSKITRHKLKVIFTAFKYWLRHKGIREYSCCTKWDGK